MAERFGDKVAVITGAGSGIGDATARRLLAEGASVIGADLQPGSMDALTGDFDSARFKPVQCDVSQRQSTQDCVAAAVATFGRLDVLVNSAGISARNVPAEADFEQAWDRVMAVNLKGSMLMSHAAVAAMKDNTPSGGAIVNIGSIMSFAVYRHDDGLSDGFNPYPHSKGGVLQLTRDIASQMAPAGIRCNAVCPGFVDTQLTASLQDKPELYASLKARHPLGRFGTAEEIANVIVFLASPEASFVTGATWPVDGGYLVN